MEKITGDIFLIKRFMKTKHLASFPVSIIIVVGKHKIGLVDTGMKNTPNDLVFPFLQEIGRKPEEISYVVNTHHHSDHRQGNKAIKETTKAIIGVHELDFKAVKVSDVQLRDGDEVELGDRKFQVIHTPGHTPGNLCLYDNTGILITGDSVLGESSRATKVPSRKYIDSLTKLLNLEINIMVMGHPYPPFNKLILVGEEPRKMIRVSLFVVQNN